MNKGLIAYSLIPVIVFVAFITAFNTSEPLNIDKEDVQALHEKHKEEFPNQICVNFENGEKVAQK